MWLSLACFAAALRRRLQKHVPLPPFFGPRSGRRVKHHHRRAAAAVGWPARETGAIGISVGDEVNPVARRQLRQSAIGVFKQPRKSLEIVKDIKKFARMEGASVTAVTLAKPPLRSQGRAVETKAENVGAAGLLLRLDAGQGRVDDYEIAPKRARRGGLNLRRSPRVVLQKLFRPLAKDRARQVGVRALRVVALMQSKIEAFVLVPAGHQRDIAVLARGEDLRGGTWQKPSVDDWAKAKPRRSGDDGVRRSGAQFGQRTRSDLAHEVDPSSLGLCERCQAAAGRREHRTALADDAREKPFGERRGHERARRMRTGGFASDRDLVGIASEGGDVTLDPLQRGDKVEKAVGAGRMMLGLGGELRMGEEAQRMEPVVHGDDNDAARGVKRAVVARFGARADDKAAAMNPDHHRQARFCPGSSRRPDVEKETNLGGCGSAKP